ncbi:MAG: methylthioribulose 1-phosphate dehydratase [Prochlorococcus sp.]|jgi:methylthioribulose-1-phosphate dehydratase
MFDSQPQREALSDTIRYLHQRGWCDGTGGNFSLVLRKDPLRLLMAPSGIEKRDIAAEQLIEVNSKGCVTRGKGIASAETDMHLEIIKQTTAKAVLHTHSITGTWLSNYHKNNRELKIEGWEMLKGLRGINSHSTSISLPILFNSQNLTKLSKSAGMLISDAPHGLLVAGHGLYAWGESLEEARRHIEILEFLLELCWREQLMAKHKS